VDNYDGEQSRYTSGVSGGVRARRKVWVIWGGRASWVARRVRRRTGIHVQSTKYGGKG